MTMKLQAPPRAGGGRRELPRALDRLRALVARRPRSRPGLELWGGVECSVIRLGGEYVDQLALSGHDRRADDLDRFAALGLDALRYPVLWERTAPDGPDSADWSWGDERLGRLRSLGVRPIVGLVHHGSGPPATSLVDDGFAPGLAAFAGAVARRFPWVEDYTPVNEPLTTARFSGLYGHWHPHGRDGHTFATALVNECKAVVLSMQAIRAVNPAARLVQTEDLGHTSSTPALAYQADFENERRWVSFDLLAGRVDPGHAMWGYLTWVGVPEDDLRWFLDNPCPPDVFGINYYLTSERFLDDRLEPYPEHVHGGNHRQRYADVEAVRVRPDGIAGPIGILRAAWERYRRPIAVTEAHLGCTREEQLRWFVEVWDAARTLRDEGADVRAVTAWSLLGAHDWDSLVTRPRGRYEPGVFDLRGPEPRPTALAALLRTLADGRRPDHPALHGPGWWARPERLLYPSPIAAEAPTAPVPRARRGRPLLITGSSGRLGRVFARHCSRRGLHHHLATRRDLDIADPEAVARALDELRPWAVVNAAGFGRVDEADDSLDHCRRSNVDGAATLARACAERGIRLLTFSTDRVFDGRGDRPYVEDDPVAPRCGFGRSKAEAERRVLGAWPGALVVRVGDVFGADVETCPIASALRRLERVGQIIETRDDLTISPTFAPDLADAALDLFIDGEAGLWHLANRGATTPAAWLRLAAEGLGHDPSRVVVAGATGGDPPSFRALGSRRGLVMPPLDDALDRFLRDLRSSA